MDRHDTVVFGVTRSVNPAVGKMQSVAGLARARTFDEPMIAWLEDSPLWEMVPLTGLEPVTPALRMRCSTN